MSLANKVSLIKISVSATQVAYEFTTEGEISKVFKGKPLFKIDYYEDISNVPESILAIPFLVNVLPIAWVYDANIYVPDIDKNFLDNLPKIKNGYKKMFPKVSLGGSIKYSRVSRNDAKEDSRASGLMFSGGVDATSSLITMMKSGQRPRLITIWGADVRLQDVDGWTEKSGHTEYIGEILGLEASLIKSTFRNFLNESLLTDKVIKNAGDNWWHGFQHGIGIIGHAAPISFLHGIGEVHIAASFVSGDNVTCASDPSIDEHLHMGETRVVHNGYDMTRQDKVANIHRYVSTDSSIKSLPIKVCWKSEGAKNCGICEKCMRTSAEIIAEGGDASAYGIEKFDPTYMKKHLLKDNFFFHTRHWIGIQNRLAKNDIKNESIDAIRWISDVDFTRVDKTLAKRIKLIGRSAKSMVRKITPGFVLRMKNGR